MSKKGFVLWVANIKNSQLVDLAITMIGVIFIVMYFVDRIEAVELFPVVLIGIALLYLIRLRVK